MTDLASLFHQQQHERRGIVPDAIRIAAAQLAVSREERVAIRFERHTLYPKQEAIITDPARFTITEATTKAGKTMSHIEWLLEEMLALGYGNGWWVAPYNGTADIAYRRTIKRLRGYIDHKGKPLRVSDPMPFTKHDTHHRIDVGGVSFWFKSAEKPDTLFGDDVHRLVGDEITRWRDTAYDACYTTLTATGGRAKYIGNVKGRHNFAYRLARKAEAGEKDWGYHKLTAVDAIEGGVIDHDIVEQAKRDLRPEVFRELYEAEASDDQGNPFGIAAIEKQTRATLSNKPPVAWGWDLAKSIDWTWGIALDEDGNQCRNVRFQKPWRETKRDIISITGDVPALVDSTGVGDPIVADLQADGGDNFEGYHFSSSSKQKLMEGLALGIGNAELTYIPAVAAELKIFEYEYTRTGVKYSAPEGSHDDGVCSLALARQCKVNLRNVVRFRARLAG